MIKEATEIGEMPHGTSDVLDRRTLQRDYSTLIPLLKKCLRVLDVGCGTGAILKGIAEIVGKEGSVVGIDSSEYLIAKGKEYYKRFRNIELVASDLFNYETGEKFDLIVSARVLQWLDNPQEALVKLKEYLKPDGQISVLDYNHTAIEWKPELPISMKRFYQAFLNWRSDAGMDNEIAEQLSLYMAEAGYRNIEVLNANEVYRKGEADFVERVQIWSAVASLRGGQMVQSGYITEPERLQAITDYNDWSMNEAELMTMKLKDVRAKI